MSTQLVHSKVNPEVAITMLYRLKGLITKQMLQFLQQYLICLCVVTVGVKLNKLTLPVIEFTGSSRSGQQRPHWTQVQVKTLMVRDHFLVPQNLHHAKKA